MLHREHVSRLTVYLLPKEQWVDGFIYFISAVIVFVIIILFLFLFNT